MALPEHLGKDNRLWFPGLAAELVATFRWDRNVDTSCSRYGTQRWLAADPNADKLAIASFRLGQHSITIERLPAATTALFTTLTFAEVEPERAVAQLRAVADVLAKVDGLDDSVGWVVKTIHLLDAPAGHDVSHSSPDLPFSIFVSLPKSDERDITLRLAESVLHESMHLQLTLIDLFDPMVTDEQPGGYSPWKDEVRPIGGLLHGLYVFAVIHQAYSTLMNSHREWYPYCHKRQATIREEATLPEQPQGLSTVGTALWRQCRQAVLATR